MSGRFNVGFNDPKNILIRHPNYGGVFAVGTTVPTNGTSDYAPGCIFLDLDATTNNTIYVNEGSNSSCTFNHLPTSGSTVAALTITTLTNVTRTATAGAATDTYKANTAAALTVSDGTTSAWVLDTRNTIANVSTITITGIAPTITAAAAAHINASLNLAAKTITYTGTTGTTSSLGTMLYVGVPTLTDSSSMTITTVSAVHVNAVAAAGGSLTITNSRMISTSVSDCFLTNAGVWTDTACWSAVKKGISRKAKKAHQAVERVLEKITPATWKYKKIATLPAIDDQGNEIVHRTMVNDRDRNRVGIIYDDLPEELRAPGEERAVSPSILASFALAAIKMLHEENKELRDRVAKLECA